jgi:hypothetical protein
MKTRNGFVSNSSSSSFIIAYKNVPICSCCNQSPVNFIDIVSINKDIKVEVASDMIDGYKRELKILEESRDWIREQLKLYDDFVNNTDQKFHDTVGLFVRLIRINECNNRAKIKGDACQQINYESETYESNKGIVRNSIDRMKSDLEILENQIANKKNMIEKIGKYRSSEWVIVSAKFSNMDKLSDKFRDLINKGVVECIEMIET